MRRYFMANGPLGGNMGSAPVAPQPPQVSFTTTAESRGGFNNFLKSMPNTTSMTPPPPPMGSSPTMPMANPMGNIDIFNQPPSTGMGMMGMNQPPMQQPMQQQPMQTPMMNQQPMMGGIMGKPVQNFYDGGFADSDFGGFSGYSEVDNTDFSSPDSDMDYSDSYNDNTGGGNESNDNDVFDDGGGRPEDYGLTQKDFTDASNVGESVFNESQGNRTNVVNVGAGSNLRYDPQFTADNLSRRGLDPQGFMSSDNFAQTTQGVQAQAQDQRDAELSRANMLSGRSLPVMGDLGASQNVAGAIGPANIASSYSPQAFGLGLDLDDPLGLGFNTAGLIEGARDVQRMRGPETFTQEARLPTASDASFSQAPNILGVEDALIGAIKDGKSDLYAPFTNNPGNLKQAREDLTTESIKSVDPVTGEIKTGPAFFNTLDAGQKALDDQLGRYGDKGISTPEKFVQTYLGTDITENPLENQRGYINAVRNAVGDNFNLSNPATRTNITNAITRQEIGQKGINALNNRVTAATGLDQAFNAPITSAPNVNANTSPPPPGFEEAVGTPGVLRQGDQIRSPKDFEFAFTPKGITPKEQAELRELRDIDDAEFAPNTTDIFSPSASDFANFQSTRDQLPNNVDVFENIIDRNFTRSLPGANLPTIGSARSTIADDQAKALAKLVGGSPPLTDVEKGVQQNQEDLMAQRGRALGPTTFRDDAADVTFENIRGQTPTTDTVFDIDTTSIQPTSQSAGVQELLDRGAAAQRQRNQAEQDELAAGQSMGVGTPPLDATNITETALGGRSQNATRSTLPEDYEENVGASFSPEKMADIERLYNRNVGQTKPGRSSDPTFFEGLGVPGIATTIGDFIEKTSRENMANEIALGRPMGLGETLFGYTADPAKTIAEYNERTGRTIPESQLIRNDSGRIIGIYNEKGRLVSGMDPNAPMNTGDDNDSNPLILRRIAKEKEEEKEDKTPNVFGGGQTTTTEPKSVVVDSPFTTSVGDYDPVGFDGGDLNALIARLLKTSNPKKAAQGGVIGYQGGGRVMQALDNLLATG